MHVWSQAGRALPFTGRAVTDHQIAEDILAVLEDKGRTTSEIRDELEPKIAEDSK
ncbi:hypothetical protein ABBQ38_000549 [Trebouxia sp. C0009 RCD-2024]